MHTSCGQLGGNRMGTAGYLGHFHSQGVLLHPLPPARSALWDDIPIRLLSSHAGTSGRGVASAGPWGRGGCDASRGGDSCPIRHPAINRGRRAVICSINTAPRLVSHRWERRGAEKPRARRGGGPPAAWERGEEGFQHLPPNARCCRAALAARLWLMHPILLALQRRSVPRQTGTPGSPPARRCLFASLR